MLTHYFNANSIQVASDVIREFAAENVHYLELRTTPRDVAVTGMTKSSYTETVIKAIRDVCHENKDIAVQLILAIDRRTTLEDAMDTVKLAENLKLETDGLVVGLDLSGDPNVRETYLNNNFYVCVDYTSNSDKINICL